MKKQDIWFLGIVSVLFLIGFFVVSLLEESQKTGEIYAKVFYRDTLVLMIDLQTNEYVVYNTPYTTKVDTG
mgnify:FL=1